MKNLLFYFLILTCIDVSGQVSTQDKPDSLQFDFSSFDFNEPKPLELIGKWEFYWDRLLEPKDFQADQHPEWLNVPGSWHRNSSHPRLGYATYRTQVKFSGTQEGLTLYIPIINAASRIWLNGVLVGKTGIVSTDKDQYKSELNSTVVTVPEKIKNLEIVMQVENYTYYSSGLSSTPEIGKTAVIILKLNRLNGVDNFFAGSLMAMFIYQMILFFLYRRGKPHLWLALICFVVATRSMIVHGGSFLLPNLFPAIPFELWKKIEFGGVYTAIALFPLYIYHLFPEVASKRLLYFFIGIATILCMVVIVTPQYVYGSLLEVCHISLLFAFAYAFYYIIKAWREGSKDAKIILFGILTAFPFILMEILKNSIVFSIDIESMYLVELGLLIFLLFQVYLLANHHAKSYRSLEALNLNLEQIVEERTRQLVSTNTVKERLLSVMSHDLKSPLNSLQGILNMYNSGAISKAEFDSFTQQIEGDLSRTNLLVENVLFWTASQMKGVELRVERFSLTRLVEENIRLFETIAGRKKISLKFHSTPAMDITWDKNVLNLVLRNLVANAIKFSYEGGEILLIVEKLQRMAQIQVKDSGKGMENDEVKMLFRQTLQTSDGTHEEKGTGLGLTLCREYLLKAGGSLTVESVPGKGSTFIVTVPL